MISFNIPLRKYAFLILAAFMLGHSSCNIDEIDDPNGASLDGILNEASKSDLQSLVTGMEFLMGNDIGFYYDVTAIIGREQYFFTGSDPRYTGELLGKGLSSLDNAGFYGTRPYTARYRTVKNGNILMASVDNNGSALNLTAADISGYRGFAKTIQAYELHLALNLQYQNGIRLDVTDPDNPGPFVSYDEALTAISRLLAEAVTDLESAGDEFPFVLSPGFSSFNTPASLIEFNYAISARIALYQGDKAKALDALTKSFFDLNGDFARGPARYYSTAGGEANNPVFRQPNQADALVAHPDFITALDPMDDRNAKIAERDEPISLDDLTSTHDVVVPGSLSDPIPYITNEELILIYAEANIGINSNIEAIMALDRIRTGNNIGAYMGADDDDSVTDEMLAQRRLSLFGQGHRWVDMRRYNRLGDLPKDRADDDVWEQMPRPVSEEG